MKGPTLKSRDEIAVMDRANRIVVEILEMMRAMVRPGVTTAQMNALGEFIRAQRQLANLSLREMASMTSVSNAYLSQVERGLHQPSLKVLHSIAAALQLSTEQLLAQGGWASGAREAADGGGTEEAIRTDPRLTPEQRAALLGVYRSFVDPE